MFVLFIILDSAFNSTYCCFHVFLFSSNSSSFSSVVPIGKKKKKSKELDFVLGLLTLDSCKTPFSALRLRPGSWRMVSGHAVAKALGIFSCRRILKNKWINPVSIKLLQKVLSQVHFRAVSEDLNLLARIFHIHLAGQSVIFWLYSDSLPHPQHCMLCTHSSEDASEGEWCGTDFLQPLKPVPRNTTDLRSGAGSAGAALAVLSTCREGGGSLSTPSVSAQTQFCLIWWVKWIQHCSPVTEGVFDVPKISVRGKK